jgi:hypothetical protein
MRPVFMNENPFVVIVVKGIPRDMGALVNDENSLVRAPCQSFGNYTPGKAGAYN